MALLVAGYAGRDLERQRPRKQSGAMAAVPVEDVDLKQGAAIRIRGGGRMGTK